MARSAFSWPVKLQALIHLSSYLVHPLMVILAIITPILIMTGATTQIHFPLIYLSLVSLGPPFLYAVAQGALYPTTWQRRYRAMPLLILLGSGIALSNSKAVIEALLGVGNVFRRTPKFSVTSTVDRWQNSTYRLPMDGLALGELALSLYSFLGPGWRRPTATSLPSHLSCCTLLVLATSVCRECGTDALRYGTGLSSALVTRLALSGPTLNAHAFKPSTPRARPPRPHAGRHPCFWTKRAMCSNACSIFS